MEARGQGAPDQWDASEEAEVLRTVYRSVLRLWEVADDLTTIRPDQLSNYSVTIFGSARLVPGTQRYSDVKRLASELAAMGCTVITGGGPGLMQAANEGALEGAPAHPERSVGIRIALEFEQEMNPYVGEGHEHVTFFTRLHHFVLRSSAFVVTAGGIGTTLELMTVWQLLQVRHLRGTPLVLVGDMWRELVDWARRNMTSGPIPLASADDVDIPTCVDTVDEALALIEADYERWRLLQGAST